MESPPDPDRELRKTVAPGSDPPKDSPSIFVQGFQFFLVPMALVVICVGVYLMATWMVYERKTIRQWVGEIKVGGGHARAHATLQLASELRAAAEEENPVPAEVVPDLVEILRDTQESEFDFRYYLIQCLGLLADDRGTETLTEVLREDKSLEIKAACLDALGAIGDPAALPVVLRMVKHESTTVRKYAVFNLAVILSETKADPELIVILRKTLEDSSTEVRWNAACSMALYLGDPSGLVILRKMLDRNYVEGIIGDDSQRENMARHAMTMACKGLIALRDRDSLGDLHRVGREDRDQEVRWAALSAESLIDKEP